MTFKTIIETFTKDDLKFILKKLNDSLYKNSWKKSKLIEKILGYDVHLVVQTFTLKHLKLGLKKIGKSEEGQEEELVKQLFEFLGSKEASTEISDNELEFSTNEQDLNFEGADSTYLTHGLHQYPARMMPQLAERLISDIKSLFLEQRQRDEATVLTLLDPFCGSGTTLVEGLRQNVNVIGLDINPFAVFLSKQKTKTDHEYDVLTKKIHHFLGDFKVNLASREKKLEVCSIHEYYKEFLKIHLPRVSNERLDFWFPHKSMFEIDQFLKEIQKYDEDVRNFLSLGLTDSLRKISFQTSTYKSHREKTISKRQYTPLYDLVETTLVEKKTLSQNFSKTINSNLSRMVICTDVLSCDIEDGSIDMIVTSPPYGDSKTTMGYGQFSDIPMQLLELGEEQSATTLEKNMLGGVKREVQQIGCVEIDNFIISISDVERQKEVYSFCFDYHMAIERIVKLLKPDGKIAFVVANRNVDKQSQPLDIYTMWCFEQSNLKHISTRQRQIFQSQQAASMTHEIILLFEKVP